MANLGTAQSKNFQIGNAELRIGTMSEAGRLTQKGHSVGLLQSANVNFSQQVAELKGGLPLQLVDSVITETTVTVSAQAYEYTRRNIRAMLNEGIKTGEKDYALVGTLTTATPFTDGGGTASFDNAGDAVVGLYDSDFTLTPTASGFTTVFGLTACSSLGDVIPASTNFIPTVGQKVLLGVYAEGKPEELSVVEASVAATTAEVGTAGTGTFSFTISSNTPLLFDYKQGTRLVVYTINPVGLGNSASTQYYTIDLLSKNHSTNLVQGFRFWKASIQGGMDYSFSNDSFAVTPLTFKVLLPTQEDLDDSTSLNGLGKIASIQAAGNPLGMFWNGQAK